MRRIFKAPQKTKTEDIDTTRRSYNDNKIHQYLHKLSFGTLMLIAICLLAVAGYTFAKNQGSSSAATLN